MIRLKLIRCVEFTSQKKQWVVSLIVNTLWSAKPGQTKAFRSLFVIIQSLPTLLAKNNLCKNTSWIPIMLRLQRLLWYHTVIATLENYVYFISIICATYRDISIPQTFTHNTFITISRIIFVKFVCLSHCSRAISFNVCMYFIILIA